MLPDHTFRVVVRETYEVEYLIEADSGIAARDQLRWENPALLGAVDGDPDGRPMAYRCIKRTVFSPRDDYDRMLPDLASTEGP